MADSIRDALTQAFADDEKDTTTPEPVAAAPAEVKPEVTITDPAAPVIGKPGDDTGKEKPVVAPTDKPAVSAPADKPAVAPVADAAPASWKAAEKASWATISPEGKAAILRREQETQRALSASAGARKFSDGFEKHIQPFRPLFDAYGVKEPMQAIVPLLQVRAALEIGTPEQKAELISNLVYQFGVDINQLDGFLSKGPKAQTPTPPAFDPRSMPELAPIFAIAERFKNAEEAKVDKAIAEVSSLPEFESMKEEIADVLDLAATRGRTMTIKDAYDVVARMHGLTVTPAAAPTTTSQAAAILARSRKAATSVAGAPKGSPGAKPTSLRDTISAAMDA